MARKPLGARLIEGGIINEEQLAEGLATQRTTGERLGETLIRLGYLREPDLMRVLAEDANIPFVRLDEAIPDGFARSSIPEPVARAHAALPLYDREGRLTVALANPFDLDAVTAVERASGRLVHVVAAPRARINALIEQVYSGRVIEPDPLTQTPARGTQSTVRDPGTVSVSGAPETAPDVEAETGANASEIVDEILRRGVRMGATDVHVEPERDKVRLRYRVDGILRDGRAYPSAVQSAMIARIKILAGLNIAESRLPQDGRFRVQAMGREVDIRVSTFPTMYGEDVVLRLLDRGRVDLSLAALGMAPDDVELFRERLHKPHGIIPVTGPTGSGKTTTLYAALGELNDGERCILTLEDPVEYELDGIRQGQIDVRAGLTFASGLRSLLRHDPDVILVGEMRDGETARIGLSAALTGHLVLTTLHTNTAAGAIPRLLDLGVEPFVLASSLQLVVAQRLIRVLCLECRRSLDVPAAGRARYRLTGEVFAAQGCRACRGTGFRGRLGIFEMLPVTAKVAEAMYERASAEEIQRAAGRPTLFERGLELVRDGTTSLEEVLRVAGS